MVYQSVIFDLDGTLINTLDDLAFAGNYTLKKLNCPTHSIDTYKQFIGNGIPKLVERMLPQEKRHALFLKNALETFNTYYQAHLMDHTIPYEGIPELIEKLYVKNIFLAVLSNKEDSLTKEIIHTFFPNKFNIVYGLSEQFLPKPNPQSLLHIVQTSKIPLCNTLYCGDSDTDMITAQNAHIEPCGVLWGYRDEYQLKKAGATLIASTIKQLSNIIFSSYIK